MKEQYIKECREIQGNSLYTAETHHLMAAALRRRSNIAQIGLASIAALAGMAGAIWNTGSVAPLISAFSGGGAALATALNPQKRFEDHLSAAKSFTVLRHDARFLAEAESAALGDEAFQVRVAALHAQYNSVVRSTPPTDDYYFKLAQENIRKGRHEPDAPTLSAS